MKNVLYDDVEQSYMNQIIALNNKLDECKTDNLSFSELRNIIEIQRKIDHTSRLLEKYRAWMRNEPTV